MHWTGPHRLSLKHDSFRNSDQLNLPLGIAVKEKWRKDSRSIYKARVAHQAGQVDALLDFGQVAVVFEVKSSLLTEGAKRSGTAADFVADFTLKFVRDDKGKPKALVQLAESCKAIAEGRIPTVMKPARIYPVCVSDEPAVESFFFTTYSNEVFQKEWRRGSVSSPSQ